MRVTTVGLVPDWLGCNPHEKASIMFNHVTLMKYFIYLRFISGDKVVGCSDIVLSQLLIEEFYKKLCLISFGVFLFAIMANNILDSMNEFTVPIRAFSDDDLSPVFSVAVDTCTDTRGTSGQLATVERNAETKKVSVKSKEKEKYQTHVSLLSFLIYRI